MQPTGEFKGCLEAKLGHVRSSVMKPLAQFVSWERLFYEVAVMVFYVLVLFHLKSIALKSGSRCLQLPTKPLVVVRKRCRLAVVFSRPRTSRFNK